MPLPENLARLARAHRVATDYWNWHGILTEVSEGSIRAVLTALGVPAGDDAEVEAALVEAEVAPWRRTLPATIVLREGWTPWVPVHVPDGAAVHLTLHLEDGSSREVAQVDHYQPPREVDGRLIGRATFELPGDLPLGWHKLTAGVDGGSVDPATNSATVIVTPQRVPLPDAVRDRRAVGLMAQLYQVRSQHSWGIGDLGDLGALADWSGRDLGADFVLINPLHAAEPVPPMEPSPYLPTTRRFVNPIYLSVPGIPECALLNGPDAARLAELTAAGQALNATDTIDRDASWALKEEALEIVYGVPRNLEREAEFRAYRTREGGGLLAFATWCAIAEVHGTEGAAWPAELRDGEPAAVADFQVANRDLVEFHMWLQWQLDEQLAAAQGCALGAGMGLGVVHDLAVGVHPIGADAWGLRDALAQGVSVGAPPDQYSQLGQDWSQPPWRPDRLVELGYAPFRDMVRTVLRDSGGLRVDHILGMFRLWWIPLGSSPQDGAYVYYDEEAMLGILALEATRAGGIVIGEDLGVVPENLRATLADRGIFGTSILWFEMSEGRPLDPHWYRELCLTTVTTHDLPPTAGYLDLEHVRIRHELGLLTRSVEEEQQVERVAIDAVRHALAERGLLPGGVDGTDTAGTVEALHRWVGATPSRLVGVALADIAGDRRAINQPGTNREYPNWSLPLTGPDGQLVTLEELTASGAGRRLVDAARSH